MKRPAVTALLLLLVLLNVGAAHGQTQAPDDGYWWNNKSETFKLGYVGGYVQAMVSFVDTMEFQCIANKNGGKLPETVPPKDVLEECSTNPALARYDFANVRFGQLVDGTDEFYKDFRNKTIHINVALSYVRDQLKGKKSAEELEADLERYRRNASR
jgi:hypothetical protein